MELEGGVQGRFPSIREQRSSLPLGLRGRTQEGNDLAPAARTSLTGQFSSYGRNSIAARPSVSSQNSATGRNSVSDVARIARRSSSMSRQGGEGRKDSNRRSHNPSRASLGVGNSLAVPSVYTRARSHTWSQFSPDTPPPGERESEEETEVEEDQGDSWAEVRLPAIRIIFDTQARTLRRIVWLILLAVSVASFVYCINERVGHLFANPIQMNVKLQVNKTLYFPDLTLCNRNSFNLTRVEQLFENMLAETGESWADHGLKGYNPDKPRTEEAHTMLAALVGHKNRTALDVWQLCQHELRSLFAVDKRGFPECFFGRGIQCFDVGNWKEVVTVDGFCWTYHNNNSMKQTGVYNHLYMQLRDPEKNERQVFGGPGFQLLLHEARDDPRVAVHSGGFGAETGQATDAEVLLEEVRNIPRPDQGCQPHTEYSLTGCEADCFMRELVRRAGCALPFVTVTPAVQSQDAPQESTGHGGGPPRPCSTPEEYRRAWTERRRLLQRWTGGDCRCHTSCHYIHYEQIVDKIKYDRPTARTRVFYNHLFFERRFEEFSYSSWKLICDIGGSLGWTCSASLLTVFEIVDVIYSQFRARCRRASQAGSGGRSR